MEDMPREGSPANSSRSAPFGLRFSAFFLGVISVHSHQWTSDIGTYNLFFETRQRGRLFWLSASYLVLLLTGTMYTTVWYTIHFFGQTDHFLHFASFVLAFWAPLASCQVICIVALTKNYFNKYQYGQSFAWHFVLNEFSLAMKVFGFSRPRRIIFVRAIAALFYLFVSFNIILEIALLSFQPCVSVLMCIRLATIVCSLLFYTTYCYYLYVQRYLLRTEMKNTLIFISNNVGNLSQCMERTATFFVNYFQLKKLLQWWLILVLSAATLGISVYLSRIYKEVKSMAISWSNVTQTVIISNVSFQPSRAFDINTCDGDGEAVRTQNEWILFNILVVSENIMIALFALMAVGGVDFQVQWLNFCLSYNILLIREEDRNRQILLKFLKSFDPFKSNNTAIEFILPFLGILLVLLDNGSLDF